MTADLSKLELKLYLHLLDKGPQEQEKIQNETKMTDRQLQDAINGLLEKSRVEVETNALNEIRFKALAESDVANASAISDLTHEESLVYQTIEAAKDSGIWMQSIRGRTQLPQAKIKKILKTLETKKMVKSFKEFGSKTKLLYILYEIQPNKRLFGGVFVDLTTNEYDVLFIESLKVFFELYINENGHASLEQLHQEYITKLRNTGQAQVDLELEDIQRVLNLLVYDGLVEPVVTINENFVKTTLYKPAFLSLPDLSLKEIPCTRCPVAIECSDEGLITPANCVYMNQWLDF